MQQLFFRKWSNKGYAVFNTLKKVVHIGTLSLAYNLVLVLPASGQGEITDTIRHLTLDEVTAVWDADEGILPASLRLVTIIPVADEVSSPSRTLEELLDYYPFADLRTRGSHGLQSDLSIRGGSFDQSLVLLNGFNMGDPQTGHFSMNLPITLFHADRIEVLTGPSTREFGVNAYSGAVNIITSPSDSLKVGAKAEYGAHGLFDASARLDIPSGPVSTRVALSSASSDGYRKNTDFRIRGMYLHSALKLDRISGEIMAGRNEKNFGANAFYTPRFPDQYEETDLSFGAVRLRSTAPGPILQGQVHWRKHNDHFMLFRKQPELYENYHQSQVVDSRLSMKVHTAGGLTSLAAGYRYEHIRSSSLGLPVEQPLQVKGTDSVYYDQWSERNLWSLTLNHQLEHGR